MTNDDKDLKPCPFCGDTKYLRVTYQDSKANASITGDKKYWGVFCMEKCGASIDSIYPTREEAIRVWNTRATPQQPSEPLKGLDKECLCYGAWGESHPDCPIHSLEAKFGQPSEKKALSVKDIESIIETTAFNQGESFIDKKPYAQAIHSALPAQREVRYPEKVKVPHDGKFGGVSFERIKAIERNDTIDEFKKLNGGG